MSAPANTPTQPQGESAPIAGISRRNILAMATGAVIAAVTDSSSSSAATKSAAVSLSPLRPVALRCEQLANPLGIDELNPRLTWQLACCVSIEMSPPCFNRSVTPRAGWDIPVRWKNF